MNDPLILKTFDGEIIHTPNGIGDLDQKGIINGLKIAQVDGESTKLRKYSETNLNASRRIGNKYHYNHANREYPHREERAQRYFTEKPN